MKRLLPLMVATLLSTNISRADSNIPLLPQDKEEASERPRSINPEVTASIDGITITLNLSVFADCEYSVTDSSTEAVICSGRFRAGATTVFNMPAGTPAGTYRLSVYAYGKLVSCFVNVHDLMMPNNEQLEIKSYVSTKTDGLFYVSDEATLGVNTPLIYRE